MALWDIPLPPAITPLGRDELVSRINAALADNNVQGISAEDVRSRLIEIVDSTSLAPGIAGVVYVTQFGAALMNSAADNLAAFRAAAASLAAIGGGTMVVPPGTFALPEYDNALSPKQNAANCFDLPAETHLQVLGSVQGAVLCIGDEVLKTSTVNVSAAAVPAGIVMGTTSFPGNFSAYAPGDVVVVQEQGLGGNVANSEGGGPTDIRAQQLGTDFLVVATANSSTLTTTTGVRMSYLLPKVSKVTAAVKVTGTFAEGANSISGDYTAKFAVGDWVRIENLNGIDTFWSLFGRAVPTNRSSISNKSYFEYVRVKAVDVSAITFDQSFAYTYTDVWLVKAGHRTNVAISGPGYIKDIRTESIAGGKFTNFRCQQFGNRYMLEFEISNIRARMLATSGNVFYLSQSQHGVVNNISVQGGAVNSNDSAPFKYTGCKTITVANVQIDTTANPTLVLQTDGFVTPYSMWNYGCSTTNIATSTLQVIDADFFIGNQKKSVISNLKVNGGTTLIHCNAVALTGLICQNNSAVKLDTSANIQLTGVQAGCINITGLQASYINNAMLYGTGGINNRRIIQIANGTAGYATRELRFNQIDIRSTDSLDQSLYMVDGITGVILSDVRDKPRPSGLPSSVELGGDLAKIWIENDCDLRNAIGPTWPLINIVSDVLDLTDWQLPGYNIDTEGSLGVSDDLKTIVGMRIGTTYIFYIQNDARNVVLKHMAAGGNIRLAGGADKTLDLVTDRAVLVYDGLWVRDIYVGP